MLRKVCEECGVEYEQNHKHPGTEHFYCSGKCRAKAYQEEHSRTDWLMLRVLDKAYRVISERNINFELEVDMSRYPGRKGMRGEYLQFAEWVKRFARIPVETNGVSKRTEEHIEEGSDEHT